MLKKSKDYRNKFRDRYSSKKKPQYFRQNKAQEVIRK